MHLVTSTKKGFSALELQRQIGHKRYEPIWAMLHKIRSVMGQRDEKYTLEGLVEADEGFFEISFPEGLPTKSGRGNESKQAVLVMASTEEIPSGKHKKNRPKSRCKFIGMKSLTNLKTATIEKELESKIEASSTLKTDGADAYNHALVNFKEHVTVEELQ
jgi:hypothetical protein